jgi:hypothetical protein
MTDHVPADWYERVLQDNERLRAALQEIANIYANGAVRLGADVDVPRIARRALEPKP